MATAVDRPQDSAATARLPERVAQPLQKLGNSIRSYVVLEGLAWFVVVLGLWAGVSFLVDWGLLYRLAGLDYLRDGLVEAHRLARSAALIALVLGLLAVLVYHGIFRLASSFRSKDLALVLERRFPDLLGDRLVTAVELADEREVKQVGYSWDLVAATVRDAEERLQKVALGDVFNWRRLRLRGFLAAVLVLAAVTVAVNYTDAAATWAERNVLLRDSFWPRPIIVVLTDFPAEGTKAVPYGSDLRVTARAWKWVVLAPEHVEGWRPAVWTDLFNPARRPWELDPVVGSPRLFAALPPAWQQASLDEVEASLTPSAFVGARRDLGLALLGYLTNQYLAGEARQAGRPVADVVPPDLLACLPPSWSGLKVDGAEPDPAAVGLKFQLAARLTPERIKALLAATEALRPLAVDVGVAGLFPGELPIPYVPAAVVNRLAARGIASRWLLTPAELAALPAEWADLPARELALRLRAFHDVESAEAIGERIRIQLLAMFDELDRRADLRRPGRRRAFRRLEVPGRLTFEFEQVLDEEERLRTRPKRGQPEVRRPEGSLEFPFEFKKIERPLRFRVQAAGPLTGWFHLAVRPLPTLKRLVRYQDEPGYMHGSNLRVEVGPLPVSLEGDESRCEVPVGARVRLAGQSQKNLRRVQLLLPADVPGGVGRAAGRVDHAPDSDEFTIVLASAMTGEDQRVNLVLEDLDGIVLTRPIRLLSVADREPEFTRAAFEGVNRKMISPQAILPLTVTARDDHGISALEYEVVVERADRTVAWQGRLPFRQFQPFRWADPARTDQRYEQRSDLSIARVMAGMAAHPPALIAGLARLPQSGFWGTVPTPQFDLAREYAIEYQDRNLFGAVIKNNDEFLDTLFLRVAAGKRIDEPLLDPPYRLLVRLVARDSRLDEGVAPPVVKAQEGRTAETFEFQVVREQDLLIEVGRREEDLRDRCEEVVAALKKVRVGLGRLEEDVYGGKPNDVKRAVIDAQDLDLAVRNQRDNLDMKVLREFRQIYRELALNRAPAPVLDRIDQRVCQPLVNLLDPGQAYARAEELLAIQAQRIEAEQAQMPRSVIGETRVALDRVIQRLEEIIAEMKKLIEFNQALQALRELIRDQEGVLKIIKEKQKELLKRELDDLQP